MTKDELRKMIKEVIIESLGTNKLLAEDCGDVGYGCSNTSNTPRAKAMMKATKAAAKKAAAKKPTKPIKKAPLPKKGEPFVVNPKTKKRILARTAYSAGPTHPAYGVAKTALKKMAKGLNKKLVAKNLHEKMLLKNILQEMLAKRFSI